MPLDIIGSEEAIQQGVQKRTVAGQGEAVLQTWRGKASAVEALYEAFKTLALTDPAFQEASYNQGRGNGTLTLSKAESQSVTGSDVANGVETVYEMFPNEFTKKVEQAPYFDDLTSSEVSDVYRNYRMGILSTETSFSGKQLALMQLLERGTTEYLESGYVLRVTKIVSGRANVQASFDDVNRVVTPNVNNATIATLIGALPAGEWLKKSPIVRRMNRIKWQIIAEYWWLHKWSAVLYGGTGSP